MNALLPDVAELLRTLRFEQPAWLMALWLAPVVFALLLFAQARADARLVRFARADLLARLAPARRRWRDAAQAAALTLAGALCVVALARPQHSPEPREVVSTGREIVFVIDVSRSMLARDLPPNRLDRARLWVRDLVDSLRGDRVGLVAFAGEAVVKCPLTVDRGFFTLALEELTPASVTRGGSMIGDAIRVALDDVFRIDDNPEPAASRDIILITDGGDQGSFPVAAAERAGIAGVRIITIGLGATGDGAVVPAGEDGQPLTYEGQVVRSALDADLLKRVATASAGGVYLGVGDGAINLDEVYRDLSAGRARAEFDTMQDLRYAELFPPLLALAALLIGLEPLLLARRAHKGMTP